MRNLKRYLLFTALVYAVAILSGGKPLFAWFDAWIGVFVDKPKRRVYLFMLPMLGVRIDYEIRTYR